MPSAISWGLLIQLKSENKTHFHPDVFVGLQKGKNSPCYSALSIVTMGSVIKRPTDSRTSATSGQTSTASGPNDY